MGPQDAFGAAIPQGTSYDIGAFERQVATRDPAAGRLLRPVRQVNGSWQVQFAGLVHGNYAVETSADFLSWSTLGTAAEYSPGLFECLDHNAAPARFYRAVSRGLGMGRIDPIYQGMMRAR